MVVLPRYAPVEPFQKVTPKRSLCTCRIAHRPIHDLVGRYIRRLGCTSATATQTAAYQSGRSEVLLVERDQLIERDLHRLGLVIEVVVRPALGYDQFLFLRRRALNDLATIAIRTEGAGLVADHNAHGLGQ